MRTTNESEVNEAATTPMPAARITRAFERAQRKGYGVLITYFMCGYPTAARSIELVLAAIQGGADIIELGIPSSDPLADGPTIQHAGRIALERGLSGHPSRNAHRTVVGVLGTVSPSGTRGSSCDIDPALGEALEALPGVEKVLPVFKLYKLASREFHPADSIVEIAAACASDGLVRIGDNAVVMMVGPCTVESEKRLMTTAQAVRNAGAVILRGGAFKPSTSPYGFRGLGEEELKRGMSATIEEWLPAAEYLHYGMYL